MKKWLLRIGLGLIVFWGVFYFFSTPNKLPLPLKQSKTNFRIGAVNLNYKNDLPLQVTTSLLKTDFDVFVILEWQGKNLSIPQLEANDYTVFLSSPKSGTHGVCIIGKNGLALQTGLIPAPVAGPCKLPIAIARFNVNQQNISIFGVHIPPPVPACKSTTTPTVRKISTWIDNGFLNQNIGIAKKGDRVIVLGDFNMISFHPAMSSLKNSGLKSIFENKWKFTPTWTPVEWLPDLVQIDYVFVPANLETIAAYSFRVPGSDHRGVLGEVKFSSL